MRIDDRQMRSVAQGIEESGAIFDPLVEGLAEAVRRGGRLLLFAEGRAHVLAAYLAVEVLGRRHKNGLQLPVDLLDCSSGDPASIARRVGPFDAILAVATLAEDPLFVATIEAAKARGARIYCICTGRARVEGKVTVAVDAFESRPHYLAGHVSIILHYVGKRTLAVLGANPLIRPTRLDDGPPRPSAASSISLSAPTPLPPRLKIEVPELPQPSATSSVTPTAAPALGSAPTPPPAPAAVAPTPTHTPTPPPAPSPAPSPAPAPAPGTSPPAAPPDRAPSDARPPESRRAPTIVPPLRRSGPLPTFPGAAEAVPGEGSQRGVTVPGEGSQRGVAVPGEGSQRGALGAAAAAPSAPPTLAGEGSQSGRAPSLAAPRAEERAHIPGEGSHSGRLPPVQGPPADSGRLAAPPQAPAPPAKPDSGRVAAKPDSGRVPGKADPGRFKAPQADDDEPTVDVSELILDLEPDEADVRLVSENAQALLEGARSRAVAEERAPVLPPPIERADDGHVTLIQFRCKDCREPILAEPSEAGGRARCPFCGRRVKVPRHGARRYRLLEAAVSQGGRPVSLQFSLDACRLSIAGGSGGDTATAAAPIEAKLEDVSPEGVDATFDGAHAGRLAPGDAVEVTIEAPAFLEPVRMPAVVERVLAPLPGPDGKVDGRARALLPLAEAAPREVRDKLARLAELRTTAASGGPPVATKPLALEQLHGEEA